MKRPVIANVVQRGFAVALAALALLSVCPAGAQRPVSPAGPMPGDGGGAPGTAPPQPGSVPGQPPSAPGTGVPQRARQDGPQQPGSPGQPAPTDPAAQPKKRPTDPVVVANPLVIQQPGAQTPAPDSIPSLPFLDYRQPVVVGAPKPSNQNLPVFGYDFFQPARDLVLAHRAFLRRQYQPTGPVAGVNAAASGTRQGSQSPAPGQPYGPNQANPSGAPAGQGSGQPYTPNGPGSGGGQPAQTGAQGQPFGQNQPRANGAPGAGSPNYTPGDSGYPPSDPTSGTQGDSPAPAYVTLPDGSRVALPGTLPRDLRRPGSAGPDASNGAPDPSVYSPSTNGQDNAAALLAAANAGAVAGGLRAGSVNGFDEVADPLSQLYRNVAASVPPGYQLAGGDTLNIRYWSPRHETRALNAVVDAGGAITVDDVGLIVVRGQTMEQAEKILRERLRRFYNGVEASVTLARLRTIQVTLTGAAFQPGTYTVPAVATAYNVLYASGGPTEEGSLRSIEVRRNGKVAGVLDLYNYLLVGNKGQDIALQSGDMIYIPRRRSRIVVTGEVLQPAIFELRDRETLQDALQFSGGVRPSAVSQRIRISTVDPGSARIQKDVDVSKLDGGKQPLFDGDEVEVFSVRPLVKNTVVIEGAVDQPSAYALTPNMRVSDLIEHARGVISEAYTARANLYRWNTNNTTTLISIDLQKALAHDPAADIPLERWDRLTVFTRKEVAWTGQRAITVRGAVQRAGVYTLSDNMRISDLLLLAGGPTPEAYLERAVLLHQHGDGTYGMDYVDLASLTNKDLSREVLLQDRDVLAVYRTGEAQFDPDHTVAIHGAVVAEGSFPRTDGMHLSDLINLAGGFKPDANPAVSIAHARRPVNGPNGAIKVVQIKFDENHRCARQDDVALEDGDVITVQGTGGFLNSVQVVHVNGAVNRPGPIIMTGKTMRLSDAVAMAGGLRPEAFAVGAEFYRDPKMMATDSQRSLATVIGGLNDLLNENTYNRERGKSYVERLRSLNSAAQPDQLPIGPQSAAQPAQLTGPLAAALAQQEMVSPARKLSDDQMNPNGNIAVNLAEAMRRPKGQDDILLVDGDTITVPQTPTTIQVIGAVYHGRGVLHRAGAKLDYYVAQCGGFAPDAARDRIEVIHVGGGLAPAARAGALVPGDVIVVPTRVLAEKIASHQNGIESFFKSLTSSALVFRVASGLFGL